MTDAQDPEISAGLVASTPLGRAGRAEEVQRHPVPGQQRGVVRHRQLSWSSTEVFTTP